MPGCLAARQELQVRQQNGRLSEQQLAEALRRWQDESRGGEITNGGFRSR